MVDKDFIISEIQRTTSDNNGVPLGKSRFERDTGIRISDWYGKYWARWGDALCEAGFEPNQLNTALDEDYVIGKLIEVIKTSNKFPTMAELRLYRRSTEDFPSHQVFTRIGKKSELAQKVIDACGTNQAYADVVSICEPIAAKINNDQSNDDTQTGLIGYVYLIKSGRYYKIGKTNSLGRREYELSIQLPEKTELVHSIETDDPSGIEAYWHRRFKDKHKNGEWFELTREDIRAFQRRKFM